jgi:hypothetical protein
MKISGTSFHRRSIAAANAEADRLREQVNRYEAAQFTPKRAYIPAAAQDARFDADAVSRYELTRKIRYFERNTWLVQRIREEFVKWTVGPNGLTVLPATSSDDYNKYALEAYQEWCESPCLDATLTMSQVHRLIASEFNLDNEVFIHETRLKERGRPSIPAIQLIESHRVCSPTLADAGAKIRDGVQMGLDDLSRATKPVGYWVREDIEPGAFNSSFIFRSVANMHHVFDIERVGMPRAITRYHGVLDTIQDIWELEDFEMQRAKSNAEDAKFITNATGEAPRTQLHQRAFSGTLNDTTIPPDEQEKRLAMYRRILGPRTVYLADGEGVETPQNPSPSASTQWHWKYKIGQVCAAAQVPLILVFPELVEKANGTIVRGIYDNAHESFRSSFYIFAHAARKMYRFWANWARYNVPKLYDAPADWAKCHVIPPRAVNVDIGYTSAATLSELEAGITNWDDIAGRLNTTAEVLIRKKAKNIAMIHKIAAEEKIEPSEISAPIADVLEKLANAEASKAKAEDQEPEEVES